MEGGAPVNKNLPLCQGWKTLILIKLVFFKVLRFLVFLRFLKRFIWFFAYKEKTRQKIMTEELGKKNILSTIFDLSHFFQ